MEKGPVSRPEDAYRLAVEAAPNAILVVAPGGAIILANAQAEKMFGYSREELLGRSIDLLVPERFRPRHSRECHEFFSRPQVRAMGAGRDLCGLRKDGAEIPIEIGLNPVVTG
jgi:PAS domain S-box-containing protein